MIRLLTSTGRAFNLSIDKISLYAGDLAGLSILFMTLAITADTVLRYIFNAPTMWIFEISTYLLVVITFMAIAYTQRERGHIKVDFLLKKLPRKLQVWLDVFASILFLLFAIILFYLNGDFFLHSFTFRTTSATIMDFLLWPAQVFMPLGLAILGLLLMCNIYNEIRLAIRKTRESTIQEGE